MVDITSPFAPGLRPTPVDLVNAPQIKTVRVKSILSKIIELSRDADEIIIATDYDREGELIGMETVKAAGVDMTKVKRAKFSALTKGEIENAFGNLVEPDERLANAAEARQVVDLSWGAVLTRLISLSAGQVGKNFMSVGRVQSPTLKLLVDNDAQGGPAVQRERGEDPSRQDGGRPPVLGHSPRHVRGGDPLLLRHEGVVRIHRCHVLDPSGGIRQMGEKAGGTPSAAAHVRTPGFLGHIPLSDDDKPVLHGDALSDPVLRQDMRRHEHPRGRHVPSGHPISSIWTECRSDRTAAPTEPDEAA